MRNYTKQILVYNTRKTKHFLVIWRQKLTSAPNSCLPTTTSYSIDKSLTQHTQEVKKSTHPNLSGQVTRSVDDEH